MADPSCWKVHHLLSLLSNALLKEAINLIIRFISHPVAGIIKPQISNEGPFNAIRYDTCKYHVSRHCENERSSHYWNRLVIENITKHKLQIGYLTSGVLTDFDPLFVHMNKEVIEEIIYSAEFRTIVDHCD